MIDKVYYTYMLLTERNTYYCGYTDDIKKRYIKHTSGLGAKYTRANKPVKIAYLEKFKTKSEAMKEECRIKKLSRYDKDKLVEGFVDKELVLLAKAVVSESTKDDFLATDAALTDFGVDILLDEVVDGVEIACADEFADVPMLVPFAEDLSTAVDVSKSFGADIVEPEVLPALINLKVSSVDVLERLSN